MTSREPLQDVAAADPKSNSDRPSRYETPKLEKMRQLAQVTGLPVTTGADPT